MNEWTNGMDGMPGMEWTQKRTRLDLPANQGHIVCVGPAAAPCVPPAAFRLPPFAFP
uniref:GG12475 n=1 Tax=Drosophila erecta TaxID=7220 RepID=B3P8I5_DROER